MIELNIHSMCYPAVSNKVDELPDNLKISKNLIINSYLIFLVAKKRKKQSKIH